MVLADSASSNMLGCRTACVLHEDTDFYKDSGTDVEAECHVAAFCGSFAVPNALQMAGQDLQLHAQRCAFVIHGDSAC